MTMGWKSVTRGTERHVRSLHSGSVSRKMIPAWDTVCNPKISQSHAVNMCKELLRQEIDRQKLPTPKSQSSKLLSILLSDANLGQSIRSLAQLKRLYNLILRRKITDQQIYSAIRAVSATEMVNVLQPRELTPRDSQLNLLHGGQKDILKISPQKSEMLSSILHQIDSDNNKQKPISDGKNFDEVTTRESHKPRTDTGLSSLQKLLEGNDTQQSDVKKFSGKHGREYRWTQNEEPEISYSGSILFDKRPSLNPLRFHDFGSLFTSSTAKSSTVSNLQSTYSKHTRLLFYDINDKKATTTSWESQKGKLHIDCKDLFSIINGSGKSPEQILNVINGFEAEGWEVVGKIQHDSQIILFKKDDHDKKNNTFNSQLFKKSILAISGASVVIVITAFLTDSM